MPDRPLSSTTTVSASSKACMIDQRLCYPSGLRSNTRRMRLTFPGAATSMARLVTLLVLLWTGVRPVRRLDVVLVQAIAERTGVELQQPGGLLFHSSAALQSPDQQVPLNAVNQTFQVEPLRRNIGRHFRLSVG